MHRRMNEATSTRHPSPGVEGGPSSDDTAGAAAVDGDADRIVPVGLRGLEVVAADLASGRPTSTGKSTGSTTSNSNGDKAPSETKQQEQQEQQEEQRHQQEQKEEEQTTSCTSTTVAPSSSSLLQSVETTSQTSAADVLAIDSSQ